MGAPLRPHDRVLLRLPSWVGDLVMSEPVVRRLYQQKASAGCEERLTLVAPGPALSLFDGAFHGARRLPLPAPRAAWRGHDAAVLFTGSFRSAWEAWRAGIPRRIGWERDGRGLFLTDRMRPPFERGGTPLGLGRSGGAPRILPRPFTASCAELLASVGLSLEEARPRIALPEEVRARAQDRLARAGVGEDEILLLVNVGARPGSAKGFPPDAWARVLDALANERDLTFLLVCGPGEEEAVREVVSAVEVARTVPLHDPVVDLLGLAALSFLASVVLTTDSGPRHVAAAVGAPVVCIAGPTDPRHTADHLETTRLVRVEVPCGPCHLERCPLTGDDAHACMRRIPSERVVESALAFLR